jgi:hypothetical protein
MVGSFQRFAAAAVFSLSLAACATPNYDNDGYGPHQRYASAPAITQRTGISDPSKPQQCVPYARVHTGITIYGDAYTWWDKSRGLYAHSRSPRLRSVMMLTGYAGPNRAHLAVVSSLVSSREVRIDHANWFNDGAVYLDDPVLDVSAENDWTEVRIWNIRAQSWGTRTYLVRGFIGPGRASDERDVSGDQVAIN